MAEETVVAEPEISKEFGNLSAAFDEAWPTTKEKAPPPEPVKAEEPVAPVVVEPVKPVVEEPVPPTVEGTPSDDDGLPDFLLGKEEKKPALEPELPAVAPNESPNIRQFRAAHQKLVETSKAEQTRLEARIKELETVPADTQSQAMIAQQEQKIAELSAIVERTNFQNHPAIRREFTDKRNGYVTQAHQILEDSKIDPKQWDRAMTLSGASRIEALEELYDGAPKAVTAELGALSAEIRSLDSRREALFADRAGLQERLSREDAQVRHRQMQEYERSTRIMLDDANQLAVDDMGVEVLRKSADPKHVKWNERVDRINNAAENLLLNTTDQRVMALAAKLAAAFPDTHKLMRHFKAKYLEERKKNEAFDQADPSMETKGETAPLEDDKLGFADAVARAWPGGSR